MSNLEYSTHSDIISNITLIKDFTILDYSFLGLAIVLLLVLIFFVFPFLHIYFDFKSKEKKKLQKKNLIKQIAMQKDIEDEISQEIKDMNK